MGQFLTDLFNFIITILTHWQAYLTGGVITGVIGLAERLSNYRLTRRAYVALFVITFLLVSFFSAWRDQLTAVREANKSAEATAEANKKQFTDLNGKLDDLNRRLNFEREQNTPKFTASFDLFVIGDVKPAPDIPIEPMVFVAMTIRNLGAPSIVAGFQLHVEGLGVDRVYRASRINDNSTFYSRIEGLANIKLHSREGLYEKGFKPIQRGDQIQGWLMYELKDLGLTADQVDSPEVRLTILLADVTGKPYEFPMDKSEGKASSLPPNVYLPGTEQPFQPAPKPKNAPRR